MYTAAREEKKVENPWDGFQNGEWCETTDVRDFIQRNYTPYEGGEQFLEPATERTERLWSKVMELFEAERQAGGVLEVDPETPSSIVAFGPGYIEEEREIIVGLQTDKPLKRAIMPFGGLKIVEDSLKELGLESPQWLHKTFTEYRKTHNQGVFDAYTEEMLECRRSAIITGLPDAYGRGRIIGDYRRLALYGIDFLLKEKQYEKQLTERAAMTESVIREREELQEQIRALEDIRAMAKSYGFDVGRPACNAKEAVQWLYFAYLAATKDQNGAAMSLGRVSTFLDIYIERDLARGILTESEAQEIIDDFVIKLRMIRFLRTNDYNSLFTGDPVWVTECIGGQGTDGRTLVTKASMRFLNTLENLGPAPEPNMTVLWSKDLPEAFKRFCTRLSLKTSSIQYENDDLMRTEYGDDYGIACCVSPMKLGKQMQFFGARANLAKALLYAINGGVDEISGRQVGPRFRPIESDVLEFDEVWARFDELLEWLARTYVNTLNIIHYMHDKYCYERAQMAFYDRQVERSNGFGIAGLSVVADSLSAIKYARVTPVRDKLGITTEFKIDGDFPKYGNNDDRVDHLARDIVKLFIEKLSKYDTYRDSKPAQSVLTITSNVVYGKKTGDTPDGRKQGEAFAPGANPMHGRDQKGAMASLLSVAKLPLAYARDGISNTFTVLPAVIGKTDEDRINSLVGLLDGYFKQGGHHINVNVLLRETLEAAMESPDKFPQLTIRVSGYAVNFVKLTREQQLEVINRTFHESL